MNNLILTYIYWPNYQTEQMVNSVKKLGLPLYNAGEGKNFTGNGDVISSIYKAMKEYEYYDNFTYSDGGDTFFIRAFEPPQDKIIYSSEMACYPHAYMAKEYKDKRTQWCYLNGGNYTGPSKLLIEFFECYGLDKVKGDINGQHEQMIAYLQAKEEGFPIDLDQECEYFQSLAFAPSEFFLLDDKGIFNPTTQTHPHIVHGNGKTEMQFIYNYFK